MNPKAIICEIDSVLADHSHRLHFVERKCTYEQVSFSTVRRVDDPRGKPDYESFYAEMNKDKLNEWCADLLKCMNCRFAEKDKDAMLLFVTGRPEKYWNETIYWLDRYGLPTDKSRMQLFMRPDYLPCRKNCAIKLKHDPYEDNYMSCESTAHEDCKDVRPDNRPAHEVKLEIYEREIKMKYEVLFVLEDDPECVTTYRDLGLVCLDVGRK